MDEAEASRWSNELFQRSFPRSWGRLQNQGSGADTFMVQARQNRNAEASPLPAQNAPQPAPVQAEAEEEQEDETDVANQEADEYAVHREGEAEQPRVSA